MCAASFKLTIWIPVEQVGVVIGRSGQQINKIQSSSGSRLNVVPEASAWAPVYISGGPEGAFAAAAAVSEIVDEVDDAVAEFQLGPKARSALREGEERSAKRISAECRVRIRVPKEEEDPVTLEGTTADVKKALAMVVAVGQGADPFAKRRDEQVVVVHVPARRLRLIARRGQQPAYRMIARHAGVSVAKLPSSSSSSRRAAADAETDEDDDGEGDQGEEEDSDDDDDDDDDNDSDDKGPSRRRQAVDEPPEDGKKCFQFAVRGTEASKVEAAAAALRSVVQGEPVKEAVAKLKKRLTTPAAQPKPTPKEAPAAKRGPPTENKAASRGGRRNNSTKRKEKASASEAAEEDKTPPAAKAADEPSGSSNNNNNNNNRRRSRGRRRPGVSEASADR